MRPIRSFLLLLIFLACFTGLHYIFRGSQLFPPVQEFIPYKPILKQFSASDHIAKGTNDKSIDTVTEVPDISKVSEDSTDFKKEKFALNKFIDSLLPESRQVRIIYYGDSQLEGDRITSYLRHVLQKKYGGTGPGLLLPSMPIMYSKTIWLRSSSNWQRYNYLSFREGNISYKDFGPVMTVCRYLPEGVRSSEMERAFVRIIPASTADSTAAEFDILRVFYGNAEDIVTIKVSAWDVGLLSDTLEIGPGFKEIDCPLYGAKDIQIEFRGHVSPDIYGFSIESSKGIVMDNIPMRGSAGLEFTMVDSAGLSEAYNKLSPSLFIIHFGLNIVNNVRDDYSYYRRGVEHQISFLKSIVPSAEILVVSLTDMALIDGDSIKPFRNIPLIVEAQRVAAMNKGAAFWDAYDAMGGMLSIVNWSSDKPPLAGKDYTHLTYRGADTLAKKLSDDIFHLDEEADNLDKIVWTESDGTLGVKKVSGTDIEKIDKVSERVTFIDSILKYHPDKPFIFTTSAFWIFFLLMLAGYSIVYKKLFVRNFYLFVISLFFYYKSGGLFLSLLIFVTVIDYVCGLLIYRFGSRFLKRLFVVVSVVSNIGILAYFKYTGFIIGTINDILGTDYEVCDYLASLSNSFLGTSFNLSNIILPVGISFFTFQSLSYTFDVYRGKVSPVRNIIDFGFYVSFFPQLVAGPIVRASEFVPQLYNQYHLEKREFSHALFLILKGLIKKIIISDFIAINFIDRVFDAPAVYSGFENLMAVYGYGLQIYCDFSGYTDIAIGLGLILGFRLPLNFNSPYKAVSLSDFWRRWHISLSRWLKDYLYIPLGGNRKGKIRTTINIIITMLLGGLWHGASLRFVFWGVLHGIGLIVNRVWRYIFRKRMKGTLAGKLISVFITFHFIMFCWVFFRAPDMASVNIMFSQIADNFSPGSYITVLIAYMSVFMLIITGYIIHFIPEKMKESLRGVFIKTPTIVQMIYVLIIAVLLYQMRIADVIPFIYFKF